jgi:hypothetical protein
MLYNILVIDRSTVNSPLSGMSGGWGESAGCMGKSFTEAIVKSKEHGFA